MSKSIKLNLFYSSIIGIVFIFTFLFFTFIPKAQACAPEDFRCWFGVCAPGTTECTDGLCVLGGPGSCGTTAGGGVDCSPGVPCPGNGCPAAAADWCGNLCPDNPYSCGTACVTNLSQCTPPGGNPGFACSGGACVARINGAYSTSDCNSSCSVSSGTCGNGICNASEDINNCPIDCGGGGAGGTSSYFKVHAIPDPVSIMVGQTYTFTVDTSGVGDTADTFIGLQQSGGPAGGSFSKVCYMKRSGPDVCTNDTVNSFAISYCNGDSFCSEGQGEHYDSAGIDAKVTYSGVATTPGNYDLTFKGTRITNPYDTSIATVHMTVNVPLPATPTNVVVTPVGCGVNSLNVSWNAAANATTYQLLRDSNVSGPIYDGPGTSFTDFGNGFLFGSVHTYWVRATNFSGTSALSAPASGTVAAATCPVMSGTLTPAASSCVIAKDASSCSINFSWATINPVATSAVTSDTTNTGVAAANTNVANGNSGGPTAFTIPYPGRNFYLYNNAVKLAERTSLSNPITATCFGGTAWNGTTCSSIINGGWSAWSAWSSCSVSCGGGTQTAIRTCTNPVPSGGGANCVGSPVQSQACNAQACTGGIISANPTTIVEGGSTTLSWSSPAASCTGTNFNTGNAPNGNILVSPTSTVTYSIACSNGTTGQVTVTVRKKPIFIEN